MADIFQNKTREDYVTLAKWAEKCERWSDMVYLVNKFAKIGTTELTLEERNLVAVAYKYQAGSRRAAWRVLSSI